MYRNFPCIKGGDGKKKVKVVENWIFGKLGCLVITSWLFQLFHL
jgi:hypothetical protein